MIAAFHAAVATASAGATIVMQGDEAGPIVVRAPLTIDGAGHVLSVKTGSAIDVEAPHVTIRNLTIRGGGDDLSGRAPALLVHSRDVRLENVRFTENRFAFAADSASDVVLHRVEIRSNDPNGDPIRIYRSSNVRIEASSVEGGRDVFVSWSPGTTVVHSRFSHLRYGLHDMFSPNLTLDADAFENCEIGTNFMYAQGLRVSNSRFSSNRGAAGYGVGLEDTDDASFTGNLFAGNHVGINLVDSPSHDGAPIEIDGNLFASNGSGLSLQSNARSIAVTRNSFVSNIEQVQVSGGGSAPAVAWSGPDGGNYWSDYGGYARDGSAFGALAYRPASTFESVADANPDLQLFRESAAASAIDFATRSLVAQPPPKLIDDHPFIHPPLAAFAVGAPAVGREADASGGHGAGSSGIPIALAIVSMLLAVRRKRQQLSVKDAAPLPAVELRSVTKQYRNGRGIRDVSLRVERGECVALWGPNGAGKTTLLRSLLGQTSYSGTVAIDGVIRSSSDAQLAQLIGYAPQFLPSFEMPVAAFVRALAALRRAEMSSVDALFARFELDPRDRRSIAELSGGLRQRLSVACALIGDPPCVVVDEPTAGLDRRSRAGVLAVLAECKRAGTTLLFTSHLSSDVRALADRVVVIEDGAVASEYSVSSFLESES